MRRLLWNPKVHYRVQRSLVQAPPQSTPLYTISLRSILKLSSHLRLETCLLQALSPTLQAHFSVIVLNLQK
jgi:hypothetical protein